jgi:hypothetical protein
MGRDIECRKIERTTMADDDQNDQSNQSTSADTWAQGLGVSVESLNQGDSNPADNNQGSSDPPPAPAAAESNSAGAGGGAPSPDYQQGYQDGLSGGKANALPRAGDALDQYDQGYAQGHDEFSRKSSSDPGPNSSEGPPLSLDQKYRAAVQNEDWQQAAEFLNGFSREDIQSRLSELTPDMVASIHQGALDNPRVGPNSQVAQMTRDPKDDRLDSNDDPNTVSAGEHFKIKMLDGFTAGGLLGVGSFLFAIWDIDNSRLANYEFHEVIVTFGAPISDCGEGDWSETFTTESPMQVDQFGGTARLAEASAVLVGAWNLHIAAAGVTVSVPTFFNKSFGVDSGTGPFLLTSGSVKVFKG